MSFQSHVSIDYLFNISSLRYHVESNRFFGGTWDMFSIYVLCNCLSSHTVLTIQVREFRYTSISITYLQHS